MSRIALVQTTATEDFQANLGFALEQLGAAVAGGAALVAFPEVFLYVGGKEGKLNHALTLDGEVVARFRAEAQRHRVWILLGSIHERIPGRADKVHNTSVLIGPDGALAGIYRKRNLFDVDLPGQRILESDSIVPGDQPAPVVHTDLGAVGLTICFDLRFPGLYRQLRRDGAQIVFAPSNFTVPTGAAHWETLLRARATGPTQSQVPLLRPYGPGRSLGQHHRPRPRQDRHHLRRNRLGLSGAGAETGADAGGGVGV